MYSEYCRHIVWLNVCVNVCDTLFVVFHVYVLFILLFKLMIADVFFCNGILYKLCPIIVAMYVQLFCK